MKRILLSVCSVLLICGLVNAESYEAIYKKLPSISAEQLSQHESNKNAIENAAFQLKTAEQAVDGEMMVRGQMMQKANDAIKKSQEKNKPTKQQTQVSMAVAGDLMAALAAAGITPDQMAKMSDDEIAAILMPVVAQKNGLTTAEMQKMQGMSDAEANAYLSQGDRASRVKNSEYGKYGDTLKDMGKGLDISDADYKKIDELLEMDEKIESNDASQALITKFNSINKEVFEVEMEKLFADKYEGRINSILSDLYDRAYKEYGTKVSGEGIKMPAYGKEYYSKVNALIDEYNKEVVDMWESKIGEITTPLKSTLDEKFTICAESEKLYASLTSDDAKHMATKTQMQTSVATLLRYYIQLLDMRLQAPTRNHYEMPTAIGGMG